MAQHVRAQRFAHMTPLLWFMLAVGGVLLIAALVMAGYMLINRGQEQMMPLLMLTVMLMTGVMSPVSVLSHRRRREMEGQV
ncbi:MAG: hypothetical protein ACTHV8_08100 [Nesterenkonia sp.]